MVEVFKTNVTNQKDANEIINSIEHFPDHKINFDLEDCDNILRVENLNGGLEIENIIQIVTGFGFWIEILNDEVFCYLPNERIK